MRKSRRNVSAIWNSEPAPLESRDPTNRLYIIAIGESERWSTYETIKRTFRTELPRPQESSGPPANQFGWLRQILPALLVALAIRMVVVFFTFRDLPDADKHYEAFGWEMGWIARGRQTADNLLGHAGNADRIALLRAQTATDERRIHGGLIRPLTASRCLR